jgi:hypothetical protein
VLTLDEARASAKAQFDALIASLQASPELVPALPRITFAATGRNITARVYKSNHEYHVEIGDGFVSQLLASIERLDEQQIALIVGSKRRNARDVLDPGAVRAVLYAVAEKFVLCHELFHVLCGHLDHRIKSSGGSDLALDEFALAEETGARASDYDRSPAELDLAFFRELEADDTAVQFLAGMSRIEELAALIPALDPEPDLSSMPKGQGRLLAFRLLFAALWQVVLLFETSRPPKREPTVHPFPASRLMSLLFTLMPYYLIDEETPEYELGERVRLTEKTAELAREYMRAVVQPAMLFALSQNHRYDAATGPAESDPGESSLFGDTLRDLKALIVDAEVQTPGGRQLRKALEQRAEHVRALRPFRLVSL